MKLKVAALVAVLGGMFALAACTGPLTIPSSADIQRTATAAVGTLVPGVQTQLATIVPGVQTTLATTVPGIQTQAAGAAASATAAARR
ncbi:MAG: hypothetical protein U0556_04850 [Dehalococcoidia bacterium]